MRLFLADGVKTVEKTAKKSYNSIMNKNQPEKSGAVLTKSGGTAFTLAVVFSITLSFLYSLIITLVSKQSGLNVNEITSKNGVIILSFFLGSLSVICALFATFLRAKIPFKTLMPEKTEDKFVYLPLALITFGFMFGLAEANNVFVSFLNKLGLNYGAVILPEKSPVNVILTIVFVCVIPPLAEEALFRGVLLNSLKGFGVWGAAGISAAAFSLFHMSPAQTVYQFMVGFLYALVARKAKSYLPTAVSHIINNLYVVLNYYFWGFAPAGAAKIVLTACALVSLLAGVMLLIFVRPEKGGDGDLNDSKTALKNMILGFIVCGVMWIIGLF